jgi:ribose transport system substrate-binding protein
MFRKLISLLFVVILLAGCVGKPTAAPVVVPTANPHLVDLSKYQYGKPFRLLVTNQNVPVVKIMIAGFFSACKDFGLDCVLMGVDGNDLAGSATKTEQAIALGASGIFSTIYDPSQYEPNNKVVQAGIPVIDIHFPMTDTTIVPGMLAWIAPDNSGYGYQAGLVMGDKIGCKGKVAITQSAVASAGEGKVTAGFTKALSTKCPDVIILPMQVETTDASQAIAVTSAILTANPDLAGAFSTTGGGATAWSKSLQDAGKKPGDVIVIGMDYSRENLDTVKAGWVYALVGQPLYEEFYGAVTLMLEHLMGNPVPYGNYLPAPFIYVSNISNYYAINDKADAVKP